MIRSHGLFHDVRTDAGTLLCTARGRLKLERRETGGLAVGDRVVVEPGSTDGEGVIVAAHPRGRALMRKGVLRGQPDQIILANPDLVLAVFSVAEPSPHARMLDRFLVLADAHGLEAAICANKIDLDPTGRLRDVFQPYVEIGYPVVYTSSHTGEGLEELRSLIAGHIVVLAGPSGVGKTSLINRIAGTTLATNQISEATGKGRHTTRGATLIPVGQGYVADTAGIRALALAGVDRSELDLHFPEFAPYLTTCRFADCAHESEPGCAIAAAAEAGKIHPTRYESYRQLRARFDED